MKEKKLSISMFDCKFSRFHLYFILQQLWTNTQFQFTANVNSVTDTDGVMHTIN